MQLFALGCIPSHNVLFTRISFAIVLASSRIVTMKATRQIISNSLTQTIVKIAYKGLSESGPPIPIDGRGFPSDGYAGHRKGLKRRRSCRAEASQLIVAKISLNPLAIDFHDAPLRPRRGLRSGNLLQTKVAHNQRAGCLRRCCGRRDVWRPGERMQQQPRRETCRLVFRHRPGRESPPGFCA
jgi:hypothetical protein